MRDIKFRAWNTGTKEMLFWTDLCLREFWHLLNDPGDVIRLMQYTGLKDKYGKEIYEGDILKRTNNDQTSTRFGNETIHHVYYDGGSFLIDFKVAKSFDNPKGIAGGCLNIYNGNCEIIGNIYENPELLEEI